MQIIQIYLSHVLGWQNKIKLTKVFDQQNERTGRLNFESRFYLKRLQMFKN